MHLSRTQNLVSAGFNEYRHVVEYSIPQTVLKYYLNQIFFRRFPQFVTDWEKMLN